MKTLGLVGGTTWLSTIDYYRYINQGINKVLGGHEFARCILYSLNFGDIKSLNDKGDVDGIYDIMEEAVSKVIQAGAEGLVLCANTMHRYADRIQEKFGVPLIHIAEATASEINKSGLSTIGLLGTKYTMEEDFYKSVLEREGINSIIPDNDDREYINDVIFDELSRDIFREESKRGYLNIMDKLRKQGAEGIVLGCTEIPLIIKDDDFDLPLFDTTAIHARAAVEFALGK